MGFRFSYLACSEFHTPFEQILDLPILANSDILCGNASNSTALSIQDLVCSKAWIDFHAQLFGLRSRDHKFAHSSRGQTYVRNRRLAYAGIKAHLPGHQAIGIILPEKLYNSLHCEGPAKSIRTQRVANSAHVTKSSVCRTKPQGKTKESILRIVTAKA